jgi:hypothetical protein
LILSIAALAFWQRQTLARFAIVATADAMAHVRLSFGAMTLGSNRVAFDDVRVTSTRGDPIAEIPRLAVAYDLRDLLPGGKRLFGLREIDADSPHVTIVRRPDGTYNLPTLKLQANQGKAQLPLIALVRVRNGAIDVIDERPQAVPTERQFYVRHLEVDADISTLARSRYSIDLQYGERRDRFYPIRGRGEIDPQHGYVDQHWTASEIPIAAAVNFVADSTSLAFLGGTLRNLDARYVGFRDTRGALRTHLAASAALAGGRILIAGLSKPVEQIRGPVDVYDDGLLTQRFDATLAGVPVQINGGIYGVSAPRLRLAIRGSGDSARLRSAFAQAGRLPVSGVVQFGLLVEGTTSRPVTWINLRATHLAYASASVDRLAGLVAFDGSEADIVALQGTYRTLRADARGRVALEKRPGAVEMLLGIESPPNGVPYLGMLLPQMPLHGVALATADDPKAVALQGALWGTSPSQRMDAVFNVDSRGTGSVGPLHIAGSRSSLYARLALDRPHGLNLGLLEARNFSVPTAHAIVNGTIFGGQTRSGIGIGLAARLRGSWGDAGAHGRLALARGRVGGSLFGDVANSASFGAAVTGTPQSPRIAGTVVVAGGRYHNFEVNGNAGIAYADGAVQLHDTVVAIGPLFMGIAGTIEGLSPRGVNAARYDLAAQLHSSDVTTLLATVQPRMAGLVQGSLDADVRVRGAGVRPSFAGVVNAPEGSINGLAFRDLRGDVSGNSSSISIAGGRVVVGATAVTLHGAATAGSAHVAVDAPRTDLADFNDFFDAGDTFAGNGRLALEADVRGMHVVASSGRADFTRARFRRLELGDVAARWRTHGGAVVSSVRFGGPTGEVAFAGSVIPAAMSVNLRVTAHAIDLGTWLPMLGFTAPITGRLDAQTSLSGTYPDIAMNVHAAIFGGTAGRLPIERFELTASASHGRGRIASAVLEVPSLRTAASGTFGLRPGDALALTAHSTSPDVGAFLRTATGKDVRVSGALDSTLYLGGTRSAPHLRDALALQSVRYGNLTIPRVAGEIDVDRRAVRVQNGEVDLQRGRALLSATVPIRETTSGVAPGGGPISASLRADDIELSNFAGLLPKGTQTNGRIDGTVIAGGTVGSPELRGSLDLREGTFSGPMERSPITGIVGNLFFAGKSVQWQSSSAVGGGTLRAQAVATLASLRHVADSTFTFHAIATNARLDLPDYFTGVLNADVSLARASAANPVVNGNVLLSKARIPLNTFLNQKGGVNERPVLPNIAFNGLQVAAGPDVRVQSRNVDIGAAGNVALSGTLNAPALSGSFRSTGGSLSFYRNFNLESGAVSFDPTSGVIPDVNAVATTFVANPPTAIRLNVTGPVTNMNLALASDPSYSRQQILGILVGAQQFGAVRGVRATNSQAFSATSAATNVALGELNTAFTRTMLEPLSSSLAQSLGFTEVQITTDIQTGVGVSAVKAFGKYVSAIFSQSFGYPKTQSIAFEAHPNEGTGLRVMAYTSTGPTVLSLQQPQPIGIDVMNLNPLTAFTPVGGTNGIAFSYLRKFP